MSSQKLLFELRSWAKFYSPFGLYLAPFHRTSQEVQRRILRMASVTSNDTVFDLGCGTGELLITAAKAHQAHSCVGFELDAGLVQEARQKVLEAQVDAQVKILQQDARQADVSQASVVFMYLSDHGNAVLHAALRDQLVSGTRILSVGFPVKGLQPHVSQTCQGLDLFMYKVA